MEALREWSLSAAAQVLGCEAPAVDVAFADVSTDTRTIKTGDLFVALVGENFDGHGYLEQARNSGAIAAVVSRDVDSQLTQLRVEDTRVALGELAAAHRAAFANPVVGLTGSNGKTTVKELLKAILERSGKVLATNGNFNNDIGLPLTLFRLQLDEDFAVIEMGANHPGEIAYLANIARPDVAILNNAGAAHLEGFGSLEGVAKAKGEIFENLSADGVAIINADDDFADYWMGKTSHCKRMRFGIDANDLDVSASDIAATEKGMRFCLHADGKKTDVSLPLFGRHNVMNALAASAAAVALKVPVEKIAQALSEFSAVKGRLMPQRTANGALVFDDTYNANPGSLHAGIDVLVSQTGEPVLVMGDMLEVGADSSKVHAQAGDYARQKGVKKLFAYGPQSVNAVTAFGDGGMHFGSHAELIEELRKGIDGKSVVLVKGSRGMRMEQVVEALLDNQERGN